jgi:glutathione synthase/RimK-type ligase-like ATP-grasp enzyme
MTRVALATCSELPDLDEDDRPLVAALAEHGIEALPAVWDDSSVDWHTFALVVVRSTWDYAERRDRFLDWARSLAYVLNPAPVLEWNTDKQRYLTDLETAGVPVVPASFVAPGQEARLPGEPFVVKPTVSAGGRSSALFEGGRADRAHALIEKIHAGRRTAMIQPFREHAEKALVFIEGAFSHALLRDVRLPAAGDRVVLYLEERLEPTTATPADRAIAEAALACAPSPVLYGRVDLLGDAVLELELTEPSLYLGFGDRAVERFAAAIATAAPQPLRSAPGRDRPRG